MSLATMSHISAAWKAGLIPDGRHALLALIVAALPADAVVSIFQLVRTRLARPRK